MWRPSAVNRHTAATMIHAPTKKSTGAGTVKGRPLPSSLNPSPPMYTVIVFEIVYAKPVKIE